MLREAQLGDLEALLLASGQCSLRDSTAPLQQPCLLGAENERVKAHRILGHRSSP